MKKKLIAVAVSGRVLGLSAPTAHADPPPPAPQPVQCKTVNGTNVCRFADGSVQACNPFVGCFPIQVALAPGFWD